MILFGPKGLNLGIWARNLKKKNWWKIPYFPNFKIVGRLESFRNFLGVDWLILGRFGSFRVVLAGFGSFWLVPGFSKYGNKEMSIAGVSVEWVLWGIINYSKFLDFRKYLKIKLSAVSKMYIVCALLHNARSCFYGTSTENYFGLQPPLIG